MHIYLFYSWQIRIIIIVLFININKYLLFGTNMNFLNTTQNIIIIINYFNEIIGRKLPRVK